MSCCAQENHLWSWVIAEDRRAKLNRCELERLATKLAGGSLLIIGLEALLTNRGATGRRKDKEDARRFREAR